jgi:MSHA biogenesis protein MshM
LSRRINIIADKSLLAAFADNTHDIDTSHVNAAIRDSEFHRPRKRHNLFWVSASFTLFGAIVGGILTWVFTHGRAPPTREPAVAQARSAVVRDASATPVAAPATVPGAAIDSTGTPSTTTGAGIDVDAAHADDPAAARTSTSSPSTPTPQPGAEVARGAEPMASSYESAAWQASRDWMQAQPGEHWVIQLMLSNFADEGERSAFVAHAGAMLDESKLHQYPLWLGGTKKIGVLYGPFPDRREAQRALLALPSSLKQYQPYMRTVGVVRQEARYN